jgi:nucleoside-diphosphate-sugar epimerase
VTAKSSLGGHHTEIVVVGANGTIGSAAKKALEEKEHEVVSVGGPAVANAVLSTLWGT